MRPILEIARDLGLPDDCIELYGPHKAKIRLDVLGALGPPRAKVVVVTGMTPTPLGEGKTVNTIGLSLGLNRIGKRTICTLRQPSLGPFFGVKGGAAGGGKSQVLPMDEINLRLTGDIDAVAAAHNLLAALIDNHLYHGSDWAAGEVGYLLVPGAESTPVLMENPGSLESRIGGHGIERTWRKLCEEQGDSNGNGHLRTTEIFELAAGGNALARTLLESSAQILANAVTNISLLLDTSMVVLGGAIGTSEALVRATREIVDRNNVARPRLAISTLGADAQLHGAIRLALDQVEATVLG